MLVDKQMERFLKENTFSETFDLEEHPDIRFRTYVEDDEDYVYFAQIDARLVPLIALMQPLVTVQDFCEVLNNEPYFGRVFRLNVKLESY